MTQPATPKNFTLSSNTVINILAYLGTQQHRHVADLINDIQTQVSFQMPRPTPETPKQAEPLKLAEVPKAKKLVKNKEAAKVK